MPNRKLLPFILREVETGLGNVRIHEVSDSKQVIGYIRNHGKDLFS